MGRTSGMLLTSLLLLASTLHAGPERAVAALVLESPYSQHVDSVAAGSNVALTLWREPAGLRAARIDRDGHRLDPRPLVLSETASHPVAVRGDANWLVTWVDHGNEGALTWTFIDDEGHQTGEWFATAVPSLYAFDATFDGQHFLLAWLTHKGIHAIRLDRGGAIVEQSISIPSDARLNGLDAVGFDGGGFALVTVQVTDMVGGSEALIEAFRLDANADLQSVAWLDRTSTAYIGAVHAVADGNTLVASWSDNHGNVFVAREGQPLRVAATGPVVNDVVTIGGPVYIVAADLNTSTVFLISEDGTSRHTVGAATQRARAASFGDRALVSMVTAAGDDFDLSTAVVDAALQEVAPQERLTFDPALQIWPAVARNAAGEALVVWLESGRAEGSSVMALRLDAGGQATGAPFPVSSAASFGAGAPKVVSDGTDFLVVWAARMARVLRDGTVLTPVNLPGQVESCVAWTGTEYLLGHVRTVAAVRLRRDVEISATRVTRDGVSGETFVVTPNVPYFYGFNCAAGEKGTLFAWGRAEAVEAKLIGNGGTVSGVIPIAFTHVFFPLYSSALPAVASNGNTFLTAWNNEDGTMRWATLNEHGTVSPSEDFLLLGEIDRGFKPAAAAALGDGFLLAFGTRDVAAVSLDRNGRYLDRVSLSESPALERMPAVAGGNRAVAVYVRDTGTSPLAPYWRVFTRTVGGEPVPRRRSIRH
jgi:hypothetical protein